MKKSLDEQHSACTQIRSAYSYREPVNNPVSDEPTRTKQEFVKEVNINEIVARMRRGISPPPWMTSNTPRYGDFTNLPASFQEAFQIMETAEAAFMSLPLEFRRALDHDPRNLDKAPRELYEQFGLLNTEKSAEQPDPLTLKEKPPSQPAGGPNDALASNKKVKKPSENADE